MFYSRDENITPWHHVIDYPVSLLDKEFNLSVIDNVLNYCLYKCSLEVDYCMEEVIEHTLKNYYGSFERYSVNRLIHQLDLNHAGKHRFYVTQSNHEINELLLTFETFKDLKDEAIEIYQIDTILLYFGLNNDPELTLNKGRILYSQARDNEKMYKQNIKSLIRLKECGLFE